jgi:hypothetical protein
MSEEKIDEFCKHFMKEHEWQDDVSDGNNCETCGNHSDKFTPEEFEFSEGMNLVKCLLASKTANNPIFAKKNGRCNLHTAIIKIG